MAALLALSCGCGQVVGPRSDAMVAIDDRLDAPTSPDVADLPSGPDAAADAGDDAADAVAPDRPPLTCAGRPVVDLGPLGGGSPTRVRHRASTASNDAPLETWACGTARHAVAFRVTMGSAGRLRASSDDRASVVAVYDGCPDFSPPELRCSTTVGPSGGPSVAPEREWAAGDDVYVVVGSPLPGASFTLAVDVALPIARGELCTPLSDAFCEAGTVCSDRYGAGEPHRCVDAGSMGAPCRIGGDPAVACDPGLRCDALVPGVCLPALARDAPCEGATLGRCPVGQTCVGELGPSGDVLLRCHDDGSAGGRCRASPPACDAGSECSGYLCQRPLGPGAPCDARRRDVYCGATASCQGAAGAALCVADGALDGRCRAAGSPCDAGASCARPERPGAVAMCRRPVAVGERCDPEGATNACPEGSLCAFDGGAYRCAAAGGAGGRCRTSGAACDEGLRCGTTGRCAPESPIGGRCDHGGATAVCAPGGACELDPRGSYSTPGVCREAGTAGVACRAGPSACDPGLACAGRRRPNAVGRCRPERARGEACDPWESQDACAAGTTCGPVDPTRSACIADGAAGGACRATGGACDGGLACAPLQREPFGRTCVPAIAAGATCRLPDDSAACATGAACLSVDGDTRCVVDGAAGGRCRDASPRCDGGLACGAAARCRPAVVAGGACDVGRERDACVEPYGCIASLTRAGAFCALTAYAERPAPDEPFVDACDGGARLFARRLGVITTESARAPLPFVFRAYGADVREVQVWTNGAVSLGAEGHLLPMSGSYGNFPWRGASVPLVAAFWDFLAPRTDGVSGVCVRTVGAAPDRRFVIGWKDVFVVSRDASHLSFAVVLHEATGVIDVRYAELRSDYASAYVTNGSTGALGVQGRAGFDATVRRDFLTAPTAIRYAPR